MTGRSTMKFSHYTIKQDLSVTACAMTLALFQAQAFAAPGTLSDQPLYVGPAVEPNVFLLTDDSGSMDWEILTASGGIFSGTQPNGTNPASAGGVKHRDSNDDGSANCNFADSYSGVGYIYIVEFGSNTYGDGPTDCNTADDEAWRIRSSAFNLLYFDPTKIYEPWEGVNINGTAYGDIDISNAPDNPYDPGETIDLTQHNSNWLGGTNRSSADRDSDNIDDGFRYYTWTDNDNDGLFDNGEETEFLIKDQDATTQQNFANWFSYHRSREFVAKYALSKSIVDLSAVRMGYGTINDNNDVRIEIASINLDPAVGNKKALFDKLFSTHSSDGTPLRISLRNVGRYFDYVNDSFFGNTNSYTNPILSAADYGMCQKNVTILMTDGYYNGANPNVGNADANTSNPFDGGDYADARTNTLADVAMHYYKRDLASSLVNKVPTTSTDSATHQHMNTFTVAFGVTGTLDPTGTKTPADASDTEPSDPGFAWPNPFNGNREKIDDLWHTAFNGRGEFFSAQNPTTLVNALKTAISTAAKGNSAAAAVAFNTSSLTANSVIYLAKFDPSKNWKGELTSTALNADGSIAASATWNAGDQLTTNDEANRVIWTYRKDTQTGVAFKILTDLSTTQQNDLNMGTLTADGNGQARIDYLRGDTSNESSGLNFRDRTNILGDIINSNPVYVGKPQSNRPNKTPFGPGTPGKLYSDFASAYKDRDGIIYVGANDGMLHGFSESTGEEVMAYVPNALFDDSPGKGLHYLTDPAYSHRYYVDLSPTVADVYLNSSAWKTLLVGGLRAGGRGIFALDITYRTNSAASNPYTDANAASKVLWEFDSSDNSNLGYTFAKPTITMMENNKWAVIFGNGYNSDDGEASLFILYIDEGLDGTWSANDYIEIKTGVGTSGSKNGLSTPALIDTDGNGQTDRVYAGDLEGNLWAFDLSATNSNQWKVAYKTGSTPKPLFTATDASNNPQPITSKPIASTQGVSVPGSPTPNLMVFFGTGQFIVDSDKTSTSDQSFYGIWDNGSQALDRSDLTKQAIIENGSTRTTNKPPTTIPYDNTHNGWYHDLPSTGERMVVNPKLRGKFVFYNTLIPGTDLCQPNGFSWSMAVKQSDGAMSDSPIFDTNGDGEVDADDVQTAGFSTENIIGETSFLGGNMYFQDANANTGQAPIGVNNDENTGRMSWQELLEE